MVGQKENSVVCIFIALKMIGQYKFIPIESLNFLD